MNVLVAVAFGEEIAPLQSVRQFPSRSAVVTGPGKLNAMVHVMATLMASRYDLVINLGTCGRINNQIPTMEPLEVGSIHQWDTDLHKLGDGWNNWIKLTDRTKTVLATGDRFIDQYSYDYTVLCGAGVDIVDMEAYAMARACRMLGVEFRSIKVATDDGDIDAWRKNLPEAAEVLKEWFLTNVA